MNVVGQYPRLDAVSEMLGSQDAWDYVVMDAWHFGRTAADVGQGRGERACRISKSRGCFRPAGPRPQSQVQDHPLPLVGSKWTKGNE